MALWHELIPGVHWRRDIGAAVYPDRNVGRDDTFSARLPDSHRDYIDPEEDSHGRVMWWGGFKTPDDAMAEVDRLFPPGVDPDDLDEWETLYDDGGT